LDDWVIDLLFLKFTLKLTIFIEPDLEDDPIVLTAGAPSADLIDEGMHDFQLFFCSRS
jgi:hypothetical protein